ncbi:MAG: type I-C CRISPR-associated protein Cas8c/Csd1 [Clostridia bacterium]|nr:type I-C CRISPR-associated protein Cas8c/Csd1 [Clostridia bacterium]
MTSLYEALDRKGEIPRPGWAMTNVSYALQIDKDGQLLDIFQLDKSTKREVPLHFKRSGQRPPAYFLCDNSMYCLGIESGKVPKVTEKSKMRFSLFAEKHQELLANCNSYAAKALLRFLEQWNTEVALSNEIIASNISCFMKDANYLFMMSDGTFIHNDKEIRRVSDDSCSEQGKGEEGLCLVTGEQTEIVRIHNSVKGVIAKPSPNGWTLVSFDKDAFNSYGRKQGENAPVGKYAEFAYTTALNYLLAQKNSKGEQMAMLIGDTTTVFWAEDAQEQYQEVFANISCTDDKVSSGDLEAFVKAIANGENTDWDGLPVNPQNRFYILGIVPNAARLSVRFFLQDSFGNIMKNIKEHYERLEIVPNRQSDNRLINFSVEKLLLSIIRYDEKKKKKENMKRVSSQTAGEFFRSIINGSRYPSTLLQRTIIRIRAESDKYNKDGECIKRKISMRRAALIKAVLIKNHGYEIKEALMKQEKNVAYCLGQLFCILENIQRAASPELKVTIKDRYFNSASVTPKVVMSTLFRLKTHHIRVVAREKPRLAGYFENEITDIMVKLGTDFPKTLTLEEQGMFILGYYQKRYEKKNNNIEEEN